MQEYEQTVSGLILFGTIDRFFNAAERWTGVPVDQIKIVFYFITSVPLGLVFRSINNARARNA